MHSKLPIAVLGFIVQNNKVLLLKRQNTGNLDGFWSLPGGRLDEGESMTTGAIREVYEEVGIIISEKNIKNKLIIQYKDKKGERIFFIIITETFEGIPKNMEIDKCECIEWFSLENLPEKITPQIELTIEALKKGLYFMESGYRK